MKTEPGLRCVKNSDIHGLLFDSFSHGMLEIFAVRQSNEWTSNTFVLDQLNISFVVLKVRPGWKLPLFIAYIVKKEGIQY